MTTFQRCLSQIRDFYEEPCDVQSSESFPQIQQAIYIKQPFTLFRNGDRLFRIILGPLQRIVGFTLGHVVWNINDQH